MELKKNFLKSRAVISDCGKYRYELHREWDKKKGKVLFIMLNPSTACGVTNDLTTRRCINFAKKWGGGGIMIGNIYPFRAKRPKDLRKWTNSCGREEYEALFENMDYVRDMAQQADVVICAWGCNHPGMPDWVMDINYEKVLCYLELCDDGVTPKHPLGNLSKDLKPTPYKGEYKLNTIIDG